MTNIAEKLEKEEAVATALLRKHEMLSPGIDVRRLAAALEIEVSEEELDEDVSGLLVMQDEHAAIAINKKHSENRKRFTIAHEIGHFKLHRGIRDTFIDRAVTYYRNQLASTGSALEEIQANHFAACLLMPRDLIEADLEDLDEELSDVTITQLANQYGVSEQAMRIRLAKLGCLAFI